MTASRSIFEHYQAQAVALSEQYESLTFEQVHGVWQHALPEAPARVLDVGAGSGRDAAWLARQGYRVTALEPVAALRRLARQRHGEQPICWLDDRLPELATVRSLNQPFSLILLSAVWMHIAPAQRRLALQNLTALLAHGGQLVISLRHGLAPPERPMYPVSANELCQLGAAIGLNGRVLGARAEDQLGRDVVWWQTVLLVKG